MQNKIYIDLLFLSNLAFNYILFYINSKILKLQTSTIRLLITSVIASCLGCAIFFLNLPIVVMGLIKIITTVMLVALCYKLNKIGLIKATIGYITLSFAVGGGIFILYFFTSAGGVISQSNGVFYFKISYIYVVVGFLLTIAISVVFNRYRELCKAKSFYTIVFTILNKRFKITALIDTGNLLKTSHNGRPIIIIEKNIVEQIYDKLLETNRLYAIFYTTITSNYEKLLCFTPDEIYISEKNVNKPVEAVIGICEHSFSADKSYNGVANLIKS